MNFFNYFRMEKRQTDKSFFIQNIPAVCGLNFSISPIAESISFLVPKSPKPRPFSKTLLTSRELSMKNVFDKSLKSFETACRTSWIPSEKKLSPSAFFEKQLSSSSSSIFSRITLTNDEDSAGGLLLRIRQRMKKAAWRHEIPFAF